MARERFFPLAALQYNLKRLLLIRAIVLACQAGALLLALVGLGMALPYGVLGGVMAFSAALNVGLAFRLRMPWTVSEAEFLGHLLLDVAILSVLLYFSGGANNPFVSFFLVPISISAAILPWQHTTAVAGASLLAYSLLLFLHLPLPDVTPQGLHAEHEDPGLSLHVLGMWINFLVSAGLITWFVVRMAGELRSREEVLSRYREDSLRNELVLAVATQAAGTAHELGTPLGTAAILLKEMEAEYSDQPALLKDIRLLREQVSLCRGTLKDLVSKADFRREGALREVALGEFLEGIAEQWQLLRPEVSFDLKVQGEGEGPRIVADATLQQAIVNILNNAADASPERIDADLAWFDHEWRLRIRDYGEGIDPNVAARIGTAFVSTKGEGLGVGFIVSQASINRLGGRVSVYPHAGRGTVTEIIMPYAGARDER